MLLFLALPVYGEYPKCPPTDYERWLLTTNYHPINRKSYGFRHYAYRLEKEFLEEVDNIAFAFGIDANEMLALMHHESLFNPAAFNIARDGFSENGYTPLGDGGVGLLGFMGYWTGFMHPYHVSRLTRYQQLFLIRIKLTELRMNPITSEVLDTPGGFAYYVMGSHRGTPEQLHQYLTNPQAYHPGAMYFTKFKTPYGGAKWNSKKNNYESAFDAAYKIEQYKWHEDYIYLMEKL